MHPDSLTPSAGTLSHVLLASTKHFQSILSSRKLFLQPHSEIRKLPFLGGLILCLKLQNSLGQHHYILPELWVALGPLRDQEMSVNNVKTVHES